MTASFAEKSALSVTTGGLPSKLTKTSGTVHCKSKRNVREGDQKMINLDRFGGINEPEDGVYFMTNEQMAKTKEADRMAEIEDLKSEIEDRETELKDLRAQLEELMAG
jgi:SMC interacting uncharacterized protein involved in chromosome segregation|nr:MAG TPA: protein of unknown function (DUF5320) [Caudoviricetes sp.]